MNKLTAFFLLLLRLAIGWHFAAEGFHKLDDYWHWSGVTVVGTSKPFTSAGYFREGTGPLAQYIRKEIGDPDDEALKLLTAKPDESPDTPPHTRTPPLLAQEWGDFVHRFSDHFNLDEQQRKKSEEALTKAEDAAVRWLTSKGVTDKNYKAATQEGRLPTPARLAQYKDKLDEWLEPRHSHLVSIGSNAESARLHNLKTEVVRLRLGLLNDLDEYTQDLRKDLERIPTEEQKRAAETKGKPPQPEPPGKEKEKQWWIDQITMYGLTILGACLIVGLFTRTACVFSAAFLLMTYLCTPPFPWLPSAPNNEGYYLFINKNVIEMLALLALATTTSGRWLGLDALIHWMLFGSRRPAA
jgi:uncharacterized membrane protein YphA (DoxX/SURF4 family)